MRSLWPNLPGPRTPNPGPSFFHSAIRNPQSAIPYSLSCSFLLLLLSLAFPAFPATYSGGAGIETDPYLIANATDLLTLADPANNADWSAYFLMTANIDMTGITTFTPIGNGNIQFTGIFDGGGHTVQNLTINLPWQDNVGLFGSVGSASAKIKNVGVEGCIVTGKEYVGGLVGRNYGAVTYCWASGTVMGTSVVGGLVGSTYDDSIITASYATCSVTGTSDVGGVAGSNAGEIEACYSIGTVTGTSGVGGFIGYDVDSSVLSSFWDMETSGLTTSAGGIGLTTTQMKTLALFQNAGWALYDWVMTDGEYPRLAWEGTGAAAIPAPFSGSGTEADPCLISTPEDLLALAAAAPYWMKYFLLTNDIDMSGITGVTPIAASDADPDAYGYQGPAFTGVFDGGGHSIRNLAINLPTQRCVGLFGYVEGASAVIKNVIVENGAVTGFRNVGALVGYINGGKLTNCSTSGTVSGSDHYIGGLAGYARYGTVTSCCSTASVSGSSSVGGLIGQSHENLVSSCYTTGVVMGFGGAGGLIGSNRYCSVIACYASGAISGDGGLIGSSWIQPGAMSALRVERSFWDVQTSGQISSSGGIGLSTTQMKTIATFQNTGWADYGWVMEEGSYPRLPWEGTGASPVPPPEPVPLSGSGTEADPYRVGTIEEFILLSQRATISDKHFLLTADLDGTGVALSPIGELTPFTGVFDGNGHAIRNVTFEDPSNIGIFYILNAEGEIRNLGIQECSISGSNLLGGVLLFHNNGGRVTGCHAASNISGGSWVGGLVGTNGGTVTNCYATSTISGGDCVGGLVGDNYGGTITGCHASGGIVYPDDFDSFAMAGGLVGRNYNGTIADSYAETEIRGVRLAFSGLQAGGLVGKNEEGSLSNCYATGAIVGTLDIENNGAVGGLVGANEATITGCYAMGAVSGVRNVGGLAGMHGGTITNSYATGTVFGKYEIYGEWFGSRIGGLIGSNSGTVTGCHATGMVTGKEYVGGLLGEAGGTVEDSYATGIVIGNDSVGGLLGRGPGITLTNCYATGMVKEGSPAGGLAGSCQGSVIGCHATGTVNGWGDVGGLVGEYDGYMFNCYATGDVWSDGTAGGLIGGAEGGEIKYCYATGDVSGVVEQLIEGVGGLIGCNECGLTSCFALGNVTGSSYVGGLIGFNIGPWGSYCYATGTVAGTVSVGGLIGFGTAHTDSFWDTTTGGPDNGIGTGLPTAQMKQRTTFESAGWDFTGAPPPYAHPPVWAIVEGKSYPYLIDLPIPLNSIEALQVMAVVNNGAFFLTCDLDARETVNWTDKSPHPGFLPIGTALQPFTGTFDGQGHRILGLHIYRPTLNETGLFGYIGTGGTVRRVGLEDADITGGAQTGGLAGVNLGTIEQCYVRGAISGITTLGGLVGINGGIVHESYAATTLSGSAPGGLIGLANGGSVSISFWDAALSGVAYSGGGTSLTTQDMRQRNTFISAGWDLANTWSIVENYSYPLFQREIPLRVTAFPPRLINAASVTMEVETFAPGLFVTVGGGAYPAFEKVMSLGMAEVEVSLKQEAVNRLVVSSVSETGVETIIAQYEVYESAQFPSTPTVVTALTLQPDSVGLAAGDSQEFTCTATFADGTVGDITPAATWNASNGTITSSGLYTHRPGTSGTISVRALLQTEEGWQYSNPATVTTSKNTSEPKAGDGLVSGVVRSNYTGLGLPGGRITAYKIITPTVAAQNSLLDVLGNYAFFMNEGKYHFEGSCTGYRSELFRGGIVLEPRTLINPGPPTQYSEPYYSGQIKANRPLFYNFALRPNDDQAPWVVFIEPVANTTVNTEHIVVTAIDADKYSELGVAQYTHNTVDYDIPDKISSTGFYRDTWALKLGVNVLHLYTMDTESNASEKTIQITYDPDYNTPGGDDDGDGLPNQWETDHGLDPNSSSGVNGADGDLDNDTLTNLEEYQRGTLPNSPNSDSDTLTDDFEVQLGTNPLEPDTDGDGINDDIEWQRGSDPLHDDRIKMTIVNLKDGMSVRGDAVTLLAETLPGYNPGLVASVSIEVNGPGTGNAWRVLGTPASAPFTATWDTTNFTVGSYLVRAAASSILGYIDSEPQSIVVVVSPTASYFERIRSGQHRLTAPVPLVSQTVLALREGARFAKITIPAGALASDDILTAFFPVPSSFTPSFSSLQQDARLYLDLTLVSHTGNFMNGKRVTIEMNYPDADLDDHLDDTGLRVPFLSMRYLPMATSAFVPLVSSTLDRSIRCIRGETTHFSTFGIIEEQPAAPLNLLTTSLPQGTVGAPYTAPLTADGGSEPYTWSVDGILPDGLGIVGNTLTGTPAAPGSFPITLQVADAQLPPFTASRAFTLEVFAADQPTVTLSLHPGQSSITNTLSAWWDITFSEPVSGFDTSGVTLTGTASPGAVYEVAGSGASYTLEVSALTRDGTLHPTVPSGKASSIATLAPNRASVNEQEIWVDQTKPKVQISSVYSGLQQYGTSGPIILKTLPILFTLSFDESVTGLDDAGITFSGLTPQPDFHIYGTAKNYTILITSAAADSILTPTLIADAATDAAGNGMADTAYAGREVQYVPETRATVTLNQKSTQADPAKSFPILYDIVFSAPVTDFTEDDLVYIGTAPDPDYDLDVVDATAYTLTVNSSTGDGRFAFYIPENVTAEGNAASTSTDNMVTYDATPPAITIGAPSPSKTRQGPVSFAITYTGAKTITLAPADVLLNGAPTATVSVTGSGTQTRIVTLSGISGAGPLGIRLKQGTAVDSAGNLAPSAGPSATTDVDPRLTVTINQSPAQHDPSNHLPLYFDIEFVEDVTGFEYGDITLGGTATGLDYELTGSGASYILKITAVATPGTISPRIEEAVCQGVTSGALNAPSTSADNTITYDPALAQALFTATPVSGPAPLTVQFTDQSILGSEPIDAWDWDFGDGATSDEQNPKHLYTAPGTYTVTLTVTTPAGSTTCTQAHSIHVQSSMPLLNGMALALLSALLCLGGYRGIRRHATPHGDRQ